MEKFKKFWKFIFDWEITKGYLGVVFGSIGTMILMYFVHGDLHKEFVPKKELQRCFEDYATLVQYEDFLIKKQTRMLEYRIEALEEDLRECRGEIE